MQIDFHYSAIRLISEKAGFSPADSQIIAYASQYVDDATIYSDIKIEGDLKIDYPRHIDGKFDPICTAHKGLQFLNDFKKSVQYKIYIPFHFLPPKAYQKSVDFDYVTQPNSPLANDLINFSLRRFKINSNKIENLISLGIAIHTFADTWAHQGFSGIHSSQHNDIENIAIWQDNDWNEFNFFEQLGHDILPDIGHAEAHSYPDLSFLKWKYTYAKSNKEVIRDNFEEFYKAAKTIYNILLDFNNGENNWSSFENKLIDCLKYEVYSAKEKFEYYQKIFPEIGFYYNHKQWEKEAINISRKFVSLPDKMEIIKGDVTDKKDLKWFYFHKIALEQRNYILKKCNLNLE